MKSIDLKITTYVIVVICVGAALKPGEARATEDTDRDRRVVARETMIDAELSELRREWRTCYARAQRRSPWLSGKVVVKVTFGRDGRVAEASIVSDSVRDRGAAACVRDSFRRPRRTVVDAEGTPVVVSFSVVPSVARARPRN